MGAEQSEREGVVWGKPEGHVRRRQALGVDASWAGVAWQRALVAGFIYISPLGPSTAPPAGSMKHGGRLSLWRGPTSSSGRWCDPAPASKAAERRPAQPELARPGRWRSVRC